MCIYPTVGRFEAVVPAHAMHHELLNGAELQSLRGRDREQAMRDSGPPVQDDEGPDHMVRAFVVRQ